MNAKNSVGKRVRLDRDAIVQAAILRIEQHGLEQLSARKLAQDLDCEAMSLYHHIGNMEALKDVIVDELLASVPASTSSTPAEALAEEAKAYLELAVRHPRCFRLIATRRWRGMRSAATAARAVNYFAALRFDSREALARARTLGAYLNGAGLALAAWAFDSAADRTERQTVGDDLDWGLSMLVRSLVLKD